MALEHYRDKRDFERSPEPRGVAHRQKAGQLAYVVQKHDASRLHYDFRLEFDGVLKSWAIPKGPSTDPADKRLAVHVEDHPLDYGSFEGTIPHGQYGGGTVMLWDRGWWEPAEDPASGFAKGHLRFTLHGERLTGDWSLVRLDPSRQRGKQESWLLIKSNDAAATPGAGTGLVDKADASVATRRSMAAIAKAEPSGRPAADEAHKRPRRSAQKGHALPDDVRPALATLVAQAPEGDEWLHEIKFDGYRILARLDRGKATLISRNGLDWTAKFPEIAKAIAGMAVKNAVLDGEIVSMDQQGKTDFGALQDALSRHETGGLVYMIFDLPVLDGEDLRAAPLEVRKARLAPLLVETGDLRLAYSDHYIGDGARVWAQICKLGLEGIVSKRRDAPYRAGRSGSWLKTKCDRRDEFVIIGFTDPAGTRRGFGALLLGYYDTAGRLVYAGRVGTGFSQTFLADFRASLARIGRKHPTVPLPDGAPGQGVHWVTPRFVAEIAYAQWTRDGVLRHSRFIALREDKSPSEIILSPPKQPADAPPPSSTRDAGMVGHTRISHPDRVLYPDLGITKLALAEYYAASADWILPYLVDRPLSMLRCPDGVAGECFFQKHLRAGIPKTLGQVRIEEKHGTGTYLVVRDLDGLLGLVQMGVIELHPWGSTTHHLEKPDQLIFDLDPAEDVAWTRVTEAALTLRDLLDALGLESFVKSSGGKGLHVVAPIRPELDWDQAKAASLAIAELLAHEAPDRYTTTLAKQARTGRIFIDYLRNGRGATAVAAYSVRARAGATVATPLGWDEVERSVRGDQFTVATVPGRLAGLAEDPWRRFHGHAQTLGRAALRKLGMG
jgi:bifunctional non-homologous end joining protein LigD